MPVAYLCGAAFGGLREGEAAARGGAARVYFSVCLFGCLNSSRDALGCHWELGELGSAQTPGLKVKVGIPPEPIRHKAELQLVYHSPQRGLRMPKSHLIESVDCYSFTKNSF